MLVKIYTDGAARGNPDGPGGYGCVLHYTDRNGNLHKIISTQLLQVLTFIMKNMKFIRQKVMQKEGGIVKNE